MISAIGWKGTQCSLGHKGLNDKEGIRQVVVELRVGKWFKA
jgi:hypothetical protein